MTALDIANKCRHKNSEIIQLLNLHGAESSKKNDDLIIEF